MSFFGHILLGPIRWACLGGLNRPFVRGLVFNFGLVRSFRFFILSQPPRFRRCLIGVVSRPFIRRFVSFWGIFQDPVPEAVCGGLYRRFVLGLVFDFRLVLIFYFF